MIVVSDPEYLLSRQLQFFTGKGGVGKSSMAAALALRSARLGKRPLILDLGYRSTAEAIFGHPDVGYAPVEVAPGVHAAHMELEPALVDYVTQFLRMRGLATTVVHNQVLHRFLLAAPGVTELATLYRIAQLADSERGRTWDPILIDLESTGHALMFFELPTVFGAIAEDGPLSRVLDRAVSLLHRPERTALHLVTLAEELPVLETVRLYHELKDQAHLPLGCLFVNGLQTSPFSKDDEALLQRLASDPNQSWSSDVALGEDVIARHARARDCLEELAALPLPLVRLTQLEGSALEIADALSQAIEEIAL